MRCDVRVSGSTYSYTRLPQRRVEERERDYGTSGIVEHLHKKDLLVRPGFNGEDEIHWVIRVSIGEEGRVGTERYSVTGTRYNYGTGARVVTCESKECGHSFTCQDSGHYAPGALQYSKYGVGEHWKNALIRQQTASTEKYLVGT